MAATVLTLQSVADTGIAAAQGCGEGDIPLGDLYLSFEPDVYDRYIGTAQPGDPGITPFTEFTFYLVVDIDYCDCGNCDLNESTGLSALEARLDLTGAPEVTVIATWQRWGSCVQGPFSPNLFVGFCGACAVGDMLPLDIVTFTALVANPAGAVDQRIGLLPAEPPSRVSPGWAQCSPPNGILYPFKSVADGTGPSGYEQNFIVINPTVIGIERSSFGRLKAGFSRSGE